MKAMWLFAALSSVYGHDLYLMPQKFRPVAGEKILLSAHTGDSFPNSEQPVDPARLQSRPAAEWRILGKATHTTVEVTAGGQYFAVETKPKYLEMEAEKFRAYLKEEGLDAVLGKVASMTGKSREMYSKFAKTYVVAGERNGEYAKALGLKIEIVPLADPAMVKAGDVLPVQVLLDGKPLAGAQMEIAASRGRIAGRTDREGKLMVKIEEGGKTRLHTVAMEAGDGKTHDWASYWASLTFEVASGKGGESTNLTSR